MRLEQIAVCHGADRGRVTSTDELQGAHRVYGREAAPNYLVRWLDLSASLARTHHEDHLIDTVDQASRFKP